MKQIETTQKTFGSKTAKMAIELIPNAKHIVKVGKNVLIKDFSGQTLATWHRRPFKNGILVIWE